MIRYTGILQNNVIVAKGKSYTDYVDKREIELTEEQYNTLPIPCKLVNGEFIPCEYPKSEIIEATLEEPITELEQLRADVDFIAIMTGVTL